MFPMLQRPKMATFDGLLAIALLSNAQTEPNNRLRLHLEAIKDLRGWFNLV